MNEEEIKVVIIDDHDLVRDGIRSLLSRYDDIKVINEADSYQEFRESLKSCIPDIVLLDINLPGISGIQLIKMLKPDYPNLKFLMLSMFTNEEFVINSVKAGASGYLPKNTTANELCEAIKKIYSGKEYFSKSISEKVFMEMMRRTKAGITNPENNEEQLSLREKEVLKKVAEGSSNKDIAEELCISIRTVETHKTNILRKLDFNNIVDLVKYAIKNKIISLDT